PDSTEPDANPIVCTETREAWPDYDAVAPSLGFSPREAFADFRDELRTPLRWISEPALDGTLTWNVAGSETHLQIQMSLEPEDSPRVPYLVRREPMQSGARPEDCPDEFQLPIVARASTGDLALQETNL